MPELGVRLVRAWGEESSPPSPSFGIDVSSRPSAKLLADAAWGNKAEGYEVLSTWSVEKMADRLELMERPSDYFVDDPWNDPWAEYGLGEVQELRNDYEDRLHEAHEEQRFLRQEIHQLRLRLHLGQGVDTDKSLPDLERTNGNYPEPEPEGGRLETATRLLEMAERNRSLVRQILAFQQTGSLLEAKAPGRSMQVKRAPFGVTASGRDAAGPAGRQQRSHLKRSSTLDSNTPFKRSITLDITEDPNDCESHLSRHTRQRGKGRLTQGKIEHAIEQDSICADLEHAERAQIIESMKHLIFENGDLIVTQGKPGNTFFAIHEGKADVFIDGQAVNTLSEGSAFGGLALVCACPRTATLRASGRCAVWAAHGEIFREVLRKHAKKRLAENRKFIDCMQLFDGLQPRQKDRLGDLFFTKVFEGGKQVLQEGGGVTAIYFVKHGSLSCRSLVPGAHASRQLGPGDCFGERSLMESTKLDETVETLEHCELLGISVEALKEALGADVGPKLH
jgi:CRP-like cAMP-binding protein